MTDNEKIARWAGWVTDPLLGASANCPNYPSDHAACFDLLDVLVSKGYYPSLKITKPSLEWGVDLNGNREFVVRKPTKEQAIISAVLQVVEKEEQGE